MNKKLNIVLALWVAGTMTVGGAPVVWDAQTGNGQADDGSGVWSATGGTNWWNGSQNVAWPNTSSDIAVFGANNGEAGIVTINGIVTAGGITFTNVGSGTYLLNGGGIQLAGPLAAATNALIRSSITGTAGLVKTGPGSLVLEGENNYEGATEIAQGILAVTESPMPPVTNGLLVWLDADDMSTLTLDVGSRVSAWASKGIYTGTAAASGTDRPTFAAGALNGRSVVRFHDAQSNRLDNIGALTEANFAGSNASLFVVWTPNNDTLYGVVSTAQSGSEHWRWDVNGYAFFNMFRIDRVMPIYTMPTNGSHILELVTSKPNNTYKIWMDGTQLYSTTNNWFLQSALQLGYDRYGAAPGGNHLNGDIAEVLIYTNALSESERLGVKAYLDAKWMGAGSLPGMASNLLPTNTDVRVAVGAALNLSQYRDQRINSLADSGSGGGAVTVGNGSLIVANASNTVFSGTVSGSGGLTKTGAGTLALNGTNRYSGITTIENGTLEIARPEGKGGIVNNAILALNIAQTSVCQGTVSGSGRLVKKGSGELSFGQDQIYAGPTDIEQGTLALGFPGAPISSNLLVWLDAADETTIVKDGANLVSAWSSKGAYAGSVTASGSSRPTFTSGALNGRSVVRFNETLQNGLTNGSVLNADNFSSSNASMFVVWTLNNDPSYGVVNTSMGNDQWWSFNGVGFFQFFRSSRISSTPVMPTSGAHLLEFTTSASSNAFKIWLDGAFKYEVEALWTAPRFLRIGSDGTYDYLNGDVAEILIYNSALTAGERLRVQSYLNAKWGLGLTNRTAGISLASSRISVASGATLSLAGATNAMLGTNAFVRLNGVMALEAGSTQTVARLVLGGADAGIGTWGGTGSGADHLAPSFFSGTGVLKVTQAAKGTVIIIR